jgi:hypothetical protein
MLSMHERIEFLGEADGGEYQCALLLCDADRVSDGIHRGVEELERGEGIPEDELDAYLARLKAQPE